MQKVVLKLDIHDDLSCKKKAIKMVSSIPGLDSISMDMKEKKLTVIGDMDPVAVVKKLRKNYYTDIVSVGPAKEPEKPKKAPKKPEVTPVAQVTDILQAMQIHNTYSNPYYAYARSVEEDPNACVIC